MLFIFFAFNLLFIIYFFTIKLQRAALIPLIFSLIIIYTLSDDFITTQNTKINYKRIFFENLIFIWYLLINYWIYKLIIIYSKITPLHPLLILLWINITGFLISSFLKLKSRKIIFHITIYLIEIILIFKTITTLTNLYKLINLLAILNFSIYTFSIFVIKPISNTWKEDNGLWFLFLNIIILLNLYKIPFSQLNKSAFSLQIYLVFLFTSLAWIKFIYLKLSSTPKKTKKSILSQILNWEYPFLPKKEKKDLKKLTFNLSKQIYNFIENLPEYIKFLLWALNIITIFIQIFIFIKTLHTNSNILENEFFYWGSIVIFFINFLILKYLNFYHLIQRIFFFFILNFWIYLSIINIFWKNYLSISIYWISRNLLNSFLIFLTSNLLKKHILIYEDIFFWILANLLAIPINIYFLFKTNLFYDLKLAILWIYIWIQLILVYYNFKFLKNIKW